MIMGGGGGIRVWIENQLDTKMRSQSQEEKNELNSNTNEYTCLSFMLQFYQPIWFCHPQKRSEDSFTVY